jgi:hypothetical protein
MTKDEIIADLEASKKWNCKPSNKSIDASIKALKQQAETKMGHWIYDYVSADGHKVHHCSECGCYLKPKHLEPLKTYKYCSLCGTRMIESQAE